MPDLVDHLNSDFEAKRPKYQQFSFILKAVMEQLIQGLNIEIIGIEQRTKTLVSFREKVGRGDKEGKYTCCEDMTDLSGIRIITYLPEDRDTICRMIQTSFDIDQANSIDKNAINDVDKFGYRSIHLIASFDSQRIGLPEFKPFAGLKAEIQVRTVLEHAWAAIDWKFRYKNETGLPSTIRRPLFRIAALLEAADEEFSRVNASVAALREEYVDQIERGDFDIQINAESVRLLFQSETWLKRFRQITANVGMIFNEVTVEKETMSVDRTILMCEILGIKKITELRERVEQQMDNLEIFFKKIGEVFPDDEVKAGRKKAGVSIDGCVIMCVILMSKDNRYEEIISKVIKNQKWQNAIRLAVEEIWKAGSNNKPPS